MWIKEISREKWLDEPPREGKDDAGAEKDLADRELLKEQKEYAGVEIPAQEQEQKRLLRSLCNVRPPRPVSSEFLEVQDAYLQGETRRKGIVRPEDTQEMRKGIRLWQGDITRLAADAIVNAANSQMLGCFVPCHGCIDNAIHTAAGLQLRLECARIMGQQGKEEPTGRAKITKAYNLPCRYVLHTVGPIIYGSVTAEDRQLLASCYRSCLELAKRYDLESVAFCCISTGEFRFPNELAAEIAVSTAEEFLREEEGRMEVIFNVFKDKDYEIYRRLLG